MSVEGAQPVHAPGEEVSYDEPSVLARLRAIGGSMLPIVIGLVIVWTYFEMANSNFLTPRNLTNLLVQISSTGIIAIGLVLILLIGEIDLSVGSVAGLALALAPSQDWYKELGSSSSGFRPSSSRWAACSASTGCSCT
jgi:ABC-type xylose transport system permease subunit